MKLILFSGFLGAGKTVCITSLAQHLAGEASEGYSARAVIIENEIGDVAYDRTMLRGGGHEVVNMLAGCICCSLAGDLTTTLRGLVPWYNPEYVIFEPTGLAVPDKIADIVEAGAADEVEWMRTVTLVDASRHETLLDVTPELIKAQVRAADLLLINKADLVDEAILERVTDLVRALNDSAEILPVSAKEGIPEAVWEKILG